MTQTTDDERIRTELKEHPARKGLVFNVAVTVLEIGGALVLFRVAKNNGAGNVAAYLIGSIAPILGALLVCVRSKKFSGASAAIFAFALFSAAVAIVGSTDEKILLYKDCATTAVIGLIFALSCVVMPRPVIFYFSQRYGTDGTKAGMNASTRCGWRFPDSVAPCTRSAPCGRPFSWFRPQSPLRSSTPSRSRWPTTGTRSCRSSL